MLEGRGKKTLYNTYYMAVTIKKQLNLNPEFNLFK